MNRLSDKELDAIADGSGRYSNGGALLWVLAVLVIGLLAVGYLLVRM